jgi:transcriptional regulator GlxA family with amidase domain
MAVCTGTLLLGMTGVLNGWKATTNKLDFKKKFHLAPRVNWVKEARWVEDGKFSTSSGVSAGMDMAENTVERCKYEWHKDANRGPFAKSASLI